VEDCDPQFTKNLQQVLHVLKRLHTWMTILRLSKNIFKNYPAVLLEYFVYKRFFPRRTIGVKCYNGNESLLTPRELHRLLLGLRIGSIVGYSCEGSTVELHSGSRAPLAEMLEIDIEAPLYGWKYNSGGFWKLGGIKMRHVTTTVIEVFNKRQYSCLNVEGRDVVDIGAGIGDSSVYFALCGARLVIALEPDAKAYREMLENIRLNHVEDKVIPLNTPAGEGTLRELIEKYGLNGAVLKIDCEGCEYNVVCSADTNTLRRFSEAVIEYHGSPVPLARMLHKAGFKVIVKKPWIIMRDKPIGFIYSYRE
jgi:hypothetical protein